MSLLRTRWAAVGAAVAVTLGAGGIGLVDAAKGTGERNVYTAIESCRLLDTRPNHAIGGRTSPLGPGEIYAINAHGDNGECTDIPTDTNALGLNVTAVFPTELTHLTFFTGSTVPNSSSLNPAPGQPPTPNAVTTELDASGSFKVFNNSGSVHLIVDIVGYYQDHHHDDRYYTEDEIDEVVDDLKYISLDPSSFHAGGTADFSPNSGLRLPDTSSEFSFGFTLPPDHTPGDAFDFTVMWRAGDTDCSSALFDLNFIYAHRFGQPPFGIFTDRLVPIGPPLGPHDTRWLRFRSDDQNNPLPGDAILVTIDRVAQAGCTGDVFVVGAYATYG